MAQELPGPGLDRFGAHSFAVERGRLRERLDASSAPCVLVCAPAGYGKTMLVSSWVRSREASATWVDVGRAGNSAAGLWGEVLGRLIASHPDRSADLEALAAIATRAPEEVPARLARWSEALREDAVVVLDDFHGLLDATAHEQVVEYIGASPRLRLVVVSRHDPPWPLHRLRLDGFVAELRGKDLAFDDEEAAQLFTASSLDLDPTAVKEIVHRTRGWAAGLRLTAIGAAAATDPPAYVREISGRQEYIADYLMREVYDGLDPSWREFAVRVGTVEEVCAELAEALGGGPDSGEWLRLLASRNVFIQERVDRPGWFQVHPLLVDFLRSRMTDEVLAADLHRRAARWFAEQGQEWLALQHAFAATDWPFAGDLVARHVIRWSVSRPPTALLAMLERVPREAVLTEPGLAIGHAAALAMVGRASELDEVLAAGRASLPRAPGSQRPRLRFVLDLVAFGQHRFVGGLETTRAGYVGLPISTQELSALGLSDWSAVRTLLLNNIGAADLWLGDHEAARERLEEAVRGEGGRVPSLPGINARAHLSQLEWLHGELDVADEMARRAVEDAVALGLSSSIQAKTAHLTIAGVAIDRDLPAEAERLLELVADCPSEPHTDFAAALLAARLDAIRGRAFEAILALRAGREAVADGVVPDFLLDRSRGLEAHLLRLLGNEADADRLVAEAAGGDARRLGARNHRRVRVQRHVRRARVAHAAGALDAALDELESAFAEAAPVGFRSAFVESGDGLLDLVRVRIERGTAQQDFALDLLGRMSNPAAGSRSAGSLLLMPLSERESNVLRYLVTNLTVPEIAARLYVSVNTVKSHQRSIYRKLGASSRREALDHARAAGLI